MLASPLLLGLALGVRHAADADHVATIASVVVGRTDVLGALRTAIFWGLGHTLTFFAVGLAIVLFKLQIPSELELGVELAIATSLLLLGGGQLVRAVRNAQHDEHAHAGHAPHAARPLALGCMHGLAGSAAVALLALAAIRTEWQALLYLALFGLGTMLGMAAITLVLAWSFRISSSLGGMRRALIVGAGLASTLCGVSLLGEVLEPYWSDEPLLHIEHEADGHETVGPGVVVDA